MNKKTGEAASPNRKIVFLAQAWEDYTYWTAQDKKTLRRINELIKDINRGGYEGIGKPEPLKGQLAGWWSRRIDDVNRLVYCIEDENILIAQCRTHYGQ